MTTEIQNIESTAHVNSLMTIWEAFATAQAECDSAIKNKNNAHLKYNYADINSYIELIKMTFVKHGFSVIQFNNQVNTDNAWILQISTKVIYKTGEIAIDHTSNHAVATSDITNPQRVGSYITYYRKYALQCLFCLSAEDLDAQDLQDKYSQKTKSKLSASQISMINFELNQREIDQAKFGEYLNKNYRGSLDTILVNDDDYDSIIRMITSKPVKVSAN